MLPVDRDIRLIESIALQCGKIDRFLRERGFSKEVFIEDEDCQDLCALAIIQIGECSNRLSDSFIEEHREVDWKALYGMRCVLTHDYVRVDRNVMWETLKNDIPNLAEFCERVLCRCCTFEG